MTGDITSVKRELTSRAQAAAEYLLPQGRREAGEWRAGSIDGEPGRSLGVHLTGAKAGIWADFNGGAGGDLLDLWAQVRRCDLGTAIEQAREWLGMSRPVPYREPRKAYQRPPKPKCHPPQARVLDYLREDRCIPPEVISAYKIGEAGDEIVFPFLLPDGVLAMVKTRKAEDGAKPKPTTSGCEPVLFGWQAIPPDAREVVLTEGECLPGSTEILTQTGWVALAAYSGELVAQWNEDKVEWVAPLAKVDKQYVGELIQFSGHYVTMTVTPGHRMPGISADGKIVVLPAEEREHGVGRHHRLPRSGVLDGVGIGLSLDQLAFCVAVSADATIDVRVQKYAGGQPRIRGREDRYGRMTFFKKRKIERIESLLDRLNLHYRRTEGQKNSLHDDGVFFGVPLPDWVPGRFLPWEWIASATVAEREFLIEELRHWDGNDVPGRDQYEFSTKHPDLADWVQALCHTSGRCSTVMRRSNEIGEWLKVSILNGKSHGSYQTLKPARVKHHGRVYCLTVPSGMFLARENGRVFVTGNCDALSMAAYGWPAMSVPFGGGGGAKQQWIENEFERMDRFERIYLATDMDKPGDEAAEAIADRLGRHRCLRVMLPRKDANQCLMEGVAKDVIDAAIVGAKHLDPEGLKRASEYADKVIALFWPAHEDMIGYRMPYHKFGDKLLFRPSEVTLWTGDSGSGKSQLLSDCNVAWIDQGSRVCLSSLEMRPEHTLKRMCKQVSGVDRPSSRNIREALRFLDRGLILYDRVGKAGVEGLLDVFAFARAKYGCDQFIIDSLMRLGIAGDDYTGQEKAMFAIVDWALSTNAHVHLVAHSRKGDKDRGVPEANDIKGASEIGNNAFNIVAVWRNRKLEDDIRAAQSDKDMAKLAELKKKPGVIVNVAKQRNGDFEGKIGLWFDQSSYRYRSEPDVDYGARAYIGITAETETEVA